MHRKIVVVTETNDESEVEDILFKYDFEECKSEHIFKDKDEWLKDEISYYFSKYKACSDDLIILNTKKELLMRDPLNKREEIDEIDKQISKSETELRDIKYLMERPDYKNIIKRSLMSDGYSFDSQENLMEYYNENGKFDYYDIGERWQDGLRTMMNGTIVKCNNCKIKDLYLKSTKSKKEELTRKWNFIVNGIDDGLDFDNKDDCKVNREYIKNAFLRDYVTLETYINSITINPPTAIVSSEDEWIELDELTEKERCEEFLNHLKKENPEHYIHVVDIHE
jgi:hypothetical protein